MLFKNAYIFNGDGFTYGSFRVEDGKIVETRYVPMIVDKEGVTRVVTRENG